MKARNRLCLAFIATLATVALAAGAGRQTGPDTDRGPLRLARVFSDGMVLQRDQPVRIWGWARPGERLAVEIGDFSVPAVADQDGRWEAVLPSFEAGGPRTLTVESGETLTVSDILFGDVWFFTVPNVVSPQPKKDLDSGEWRICLPETAPEMSAVAYFFARHLHRERAVPVGIVDSTWGGTPAEAWTSAEMILSLPRYRERMKEIQESDRDWARTFEENDARNAAKRELIRDLEKAKSYGAHRPDYDDSSWATVRLPNAEPLSDFVWLRRTVRLDHARKKGYELIVGAFDDIDAIFINGAQVYRESGETQVRVVSLPEGALNTGDNVIALRALNRWANRAYVGKPGRMMLRHEGEPVAIDLEGEWRFSNTVEPFANTPSFLYNGMIAPIAGYTLKGAIWYQGESNAGEAFAYRTLFPTMIQDWRVRWRQGRWPFLFVQLANWRARKPQPAASDWAELRELVNREGLPASPFRTDTWPGITE
jgi:sialate O-acetylesterase